VTRLVFLSGPHVDDGGRAVAQPFPELLQSDGLQLILAVQELVRDLLDFGEAFAAEVLESTEEQLHRAVGVPVEDVSAFLPRFHQPCLTKHAQVRTGVLQRRGGEFGQLLDGLGTLSQEVEDFDTLGAGEGVSNARELRIEASLNSRWDMGVRWSWWRRAVLILL
jgi:hypothetical protein